MAPNQDVAAKTGQSLGGTEISDLGDFAEIWKTLPPASNGGETVVVEVPAASATIIKLTTDKQFAVSAR